MLCSLCLVKEIFPVKGGIDLIRVHLKQLCKLDDDVCIQDEICIARLAKTLGKSAKAITSSLDLATQRGLITLRKAKRDGKSVPMIKITDEGRLIFGTIEK